jgi:tetratricopeptide (TPR) repeat protein
VLLAALLLAAYAGSLRGEFLWDDDLHITANPTIIGPLGLKEIWTTARANYFPLVLTNFWAQHTLWGLEPAGYRVVTLAFHLAAALLLWRVLLRLRVPGAWLGAAFWAVHPVQVESVAWICELKNTQSAVFFLAAIYCWLRGMEADDEKRPGSWYAAALGGAVAAILSKPSTVMLPVALGLCTWWGRGTLRWRDARRLAPFLALSAAAAGWTIWEQKFHSGAIGPEWSQSLPERGAIAGRVVWFYLGKLVWPEPLIFIYPRWEPGAADWPNLAAPVLAVATLAGLGVWAWRKRTTTARAGFFAAAFFVVLLFPVLGFFSVYFFRYSFVGDHFQYLASMGPLALAGAALAQCGPRSTTVAGAVLVATLAFATARHARVFLRNETLWRDTITKNPPAVMAWLNLADTYARAERYDEAIATFRRAVEIKPSDPDGWNDLGNVLVLTGRPAEAVPNFERAIALKPGLAPAHNNLGNALRDLGRGEDAVACYRRALELDPAYAGALNNLGGQLAELGRSAEARPVLERALQAKPGDAAVLDNLAGVLRDTGDSAAAVARHEAALKAAPARAEFHANYGRTLLAAGRRAEGLAAFARALELKPALISARSRYALALADDGRLAEAMAVLERGVTLVPDSVEARLNLGTALAQQGRPQEALVHFDVAVKRQPESAAAQLNRGNALAALRRLDEAAVAYAAAVAAQPDSSAAHSQLAVVLVNTGRLAEAVPHFEAALRLNPRSAELHQNFAQVLDALGRRREAFEHFEAAARLPRK